MEYKFQDVLKNIIPGFYILFGSFIICFFNGMSINKAIQKVADENYKNDIKPFTERAIYKNYYKNLKKFIKVH